MKKWIAGLLSLCLLLLVGCRTQEAPPTTTAAPTTVATTTVETTVETTVAPALRVGISLPNQTDAHWIAEGERLTRALMALGYEVDLEDAQNDAVAQAEQVEGMLDKVDCLVIAAVDSISLTQVLIPAKIPVIAYDRLIMNTDMVSGFVGFDSVNMGADLAQRIVEEKALDTAKEENRSYTVEFLMGDFQNHNDVLFYQGLMQVLKPYLESGVLVCASGRMAFEDICVEGYDSAVAGQMLEDVLDQHYKKSYPQILVTAHDQIVDGCVALLTEEKCSPEQWPLITGQQATETGLDRVKEGLQFLTVYYEPGALAAACAEMTHQILQGEAPGLTLWNNGEADIPADICIPVLINKENCQTVM